MLRTVVLVNLRVCMNAVNVQSMLEKLQQHRRQIADAAWQCHGNTTEVDLDPSSSGSAFSTRSIQVQTELQSCIDAVSSLMTRLSNISQQRALISRTTDDLSAWLETMNDNIGRLMSRPAKLHHVAAKLEISHLEVKRT